MPVYPPERFFEHLSSQCDSNCLTAPEWLQYSTVPRTPGLLNFSSGWINRSHSQDINWVRARVWDPHALRLVYYTQTSICCNSQDIIQLFPAFGLSLLGVERCGLGSSLRVVLTTCMLCKEYEKLVNSYQFTLKFIKTRSLCCFLTREANGPFRKHKSSTIQETYCLLQATYWHV